MEVSHGPISSPPPWSTPGCPPTYSGRVSRTGRRSPVRILSTPSTAPPPRPRGIFWASAMWSRYIRPGAVALSTSGTLYGVVTGALKNTDGSVIVVFTNAGTATQLARVAFSGSAPGSASAWVTNQGSTFKSTTAMLSGGAVTVSIPSKGVVTVRMTPGSGGSGGGSGAFPTTIVTSARPTTAVPVSGSGSTGAANACVRYAQCGGQGWAGCTACQSGSKCTYSNDYYSQCV